VHIAKLKVTPHLFAFRGSHGPKATSSTPAGNGAVQTAKNANPFAASAAAATASGVAGGSKSDAACVCLGVHALASKLGRGTSECMHFPQIPIPACL